VIWRDRPSGGNEAEFMTEGGSLLAV